MIKIKSGEIITFENRFEIKSEKSSVAVCVLSGEANCENEVISAGDCLVVPNNHVSTAETLGSTTFARFDLDGYEKSIPSVTHAEYTHSIELLAKLIEKTPEKDDGFFDGVSMIFNSLTGLETEGAAVGNKYVDMAKRYIDANYGRQIKIEEIANYVGTDRKYLRNLFFKYTGTSTKDYLTNLRIEKAKELLSQNSMAVNEISLSVGYPDALAFSKIFKKQTGMSPSEYRGGAVPAKHEKQAEKEVPEKKEDIKYFLL